MALRLQRLAVQIGDSDHYVVDERLDQVSYQLTLYTVVLPPSYGDNPATRTGYWCWDFRDATGTPLVLGAGLGSGVDLLFPFRGYATCPPGKLFVWTSDNLDWTRSRTRRRCSTTRASPRWRLRADRSSG
jgi:hypothetical protein